MIHFISFRLLFAIALCILSVQLNHAQNETQTDFEINYQTGLELLESKKFKEALPYLIKAYDDGSQTQSKESLILGQIAYSLGEAYRLNRIYDKAIIQSEFAVENARILKNDSILQQRLEQSAEVYKALGNYKDNESTLEELETIIIKRYGKESTEYAQILLTFSTMYTNVNKYTEAINFNQASTRILELNYGTNSLELSDNLSALSRIHVELGRYYEALIIQDRALSLYTANDRIQNQYNYGLALFMKAFILDRINEKEEANKIYQEVKLIFNDPEHVGHIAANNNIGQNFTDLGDYEKALLHLNMAIAKTSPSNIFSYATRKQNLAYLYTKLGDYMKAETIYLEVKNAMIKAKKDNHLNYGQLLNNIGKMYRRKGDLTKAQSLFKEALDVFLLTHDENHIKYGYQLNDYANTLLDLNQNDDALKLLKKNIELSETNERTNLQEYANWQFNLASAYNRFQYYDKALPLMDKAVSQTASILGNDHFIYGQMLKGQAQTYVGLDNKDKAIPAIEESNVLFINEIDKVFRFRSEKEKRDFMKVIKQNFDEIQSIPVVSTISSNKLNSINLNNQILLKGLLLNNSKSLLPQLKSLNKNDINSKIQTYKSLRSLLTKTLNQPFEQRNFDLDSLKEVVNQKEVELVQLNNTHFGNNMSFKTDWTLSRDALSENDIALEFVSFKAIRDGISTDNVMYSAYAYKYNWEHPKLISLFEEGELKNILETQSIKELYLSDDLYNLIWKPLSDVLSDVETIYYSPSGLLNQISFGALRNEDSILSNQYSLVQLSNTALLQSGLANPNAENTMFIGGINYDYTETVSQVMDSTTYVYLDVESIKGSRSTRNRGESWNELPGSLIEIEELADFLSQEGSKIQLLKGKNATETQFKRLSSNSPNILHLATHGYFYENLEHKPFSTYNLSTEDRYRLSSDPLLRSGLILAGANYAWKHGTNPMEEDDGILTALEISNLDLSNTDMVVLSACETGLGDIDGSEGVYGLQRAFKMAGVDIIVMSLWQVPDKETAQFMQSFYRQWLEVNDVRKAFNNTQEFMQQQYPDDPVKWAAFVLFE